MGTYKEPKPSADRHEKNEAVSQAATLIGVGVTFRGDIRCPSTLRVDGRVEGDIYADGLLVIGEEAVVMGNIYAGSVICQGMLAGDIVAKEEVEMLAPASFHGSVLAPVLSIDEGVLFNDNLSTTYIVKELPDDEVIVSACVTPPGQLRLI